MLDVLRAVWLDIQAPHFTEYVSQIAKYNSDLMLWCNTCQHRPCRSATMGPLVYLYVIRELIL